MAISRFSNSRITQGFPKYQKFSSNISATVLVVAGGGGGGGNGADSNPGGAGGAGGLLYGSLILSPGTAYSITVGGGGAAGSGGSATNGVNGSNSVFDSATAVGGG